MINSLFGAPMLLCSVLNCTYVRRLFIGSKSTDKSYFALTVILLIFLGILLFMRHYFIVKEERTFKLPQSKRDNLLSPFIVYH